MTLETFDPKKTKLAQYDFKTTIQSKQHLAIESEKEKVRVHVFEAKDSWKVAIYDIADRFFPATKTFPTVSEAISFAVERTHKYVTEAI